MPQRCDGNTSEPINVFLARWVIETRPFASNEHDLGWTIGRHDRTVVRIGRDVFYVGISHNRAFYSRSRAIAGADDRANTGNGKDLEEQDMFDGAIKHMGSIDAIVHRVEAGFDLGDHAAGNSFGSDQWM